MSTTLRPLYEHPYFFASFHHLGGRSMSEFWDHSKGQMADDAPGGIAGISTYVVETNSPNYEEKEINWKAVYDTEVLGDEALAALKWLYMASDGHDTTAVERREWQVRMEKARHAANEIIKKAATLATFLLLTISPLTAQVGATADTITLPKTGAALVLRDCKVVKLLPDGVTVMHSTGMAKVPWEHMPESWRAGMYYDAAAAVQYREKQQAAVAPGPVAPSAEKSALPATGLLTAADVKAQWLRDADPAKVSGFYSDGKKEVVGGVRDVTTARSKFKGTASVSDAEKLRREILQYRADIMAGVHDTRAEKVALENNLRVYQAAGDTVNADRCREQLSRMK